MGKIVVVLLFILIIIQFFPIDRTNPPVNKGMDFLTIKKPPQKIYTIIKSSCYDCHSSETVYPWYAKYQPTGWFLKNHIEEARKHLNFSTFATYEPKRQIHKFEEAVEMVEKGEMPMESYVLGHPEADLTDGERAELVAYFKSLAEETRMQHNLQSYESK